MLLFNLVCSYVGEIMTNAEREKILVDFDADLDSALELEITDGDGEVTVSDVFMVETVEERFETEVMGIHDFDF